MVKSFNCLILASIGFMVKQITSAKLHIYCLLVTTHKKLIFLINHYFTCKGHLLHFKTCIKVRFAWLPGCLYLNTLYITITVSSSQFPRVSPRLSLHRFRLTSSLRSSLPRFKSLLSGHLAMVTARQYKWGYFTNACITNWVKKSCLK